MLSPNSPEKIAAALAEIQQANPTVALGSYPYYREDGYGVQLVVRGRDASQVDAAASEIESALRAQGFDPIRENA